MVLSELSSEAVYELGITPIGGIEKGCDATGIESLDGLISTLWINGRKESTKILLLFACKSFASSLFKLFMQLK